MKPTKRKSYRKKSIGTKQAGEQVILSAVTSRRMAKLVHLEAKIQNKSVSALLGEVIANRYQHLA